MCIYLWLLWVFGAVCGLSLVAARGACSPAVGHGLLLVAASPVGGTGSRVLGLQQLWLVGLGVAPPGLQSTSSVVVVHGLSCPMAGGVFPDQRSNPCPLHWQVGSLLLSHQGKP